MLSWLRQNWWRYVCGSAALPCFMLLAFLIPNVDAPDRAAFPIFALKDIQANQPLAEVMARSDADWRVFTARGLPTLSLDPVELWYRVKIPAQAQKTQLIAELGYYLVPKVDFFLVENQQLIAQLASGMDVATGSRDTAELFYTFPFKASDQNDRYLYVRVARGTTLMAPLIVRDEQRFYRISLIRDIYHGVVLGAFFGVLLYNLVLYVSLRKRTYFYFALYLTATLIYALLESGFPALISTTIAHNFNIVARIMSGIALACFLIPIIFAREFLRLEKNLPTINNHMRLFERVILISALTIPFVSIPVAFFMAIVIMSANFFYMSIAALAHLHLREVYQFFVAFFGIFAGRLIWYANEFGVIEGSPFLGCFYQIGCIWAAVIMTSTIAYKIDGMKREHEQIEDILKNNGPRNVLNSFLGTTYAEQYAATEIAVTIMFIDIAAFSRRAESMDAEVVFIELSQRIQEITRIIHEHGGSIDRSLGDGMLCFFGYDKSKGITNHAVNAFEAAKKIQTLNAHALANSADVAMPLPVRIGIHSDRVTIGNMGDAHQVDFTMVGNGVTFANRLEASCSLFRIMVSETSYQSLIAAGLPADKFDPIMIAVKHQIDLVKAYEFDPLQEDPETLSRAIRRHLDQLGHASRAFRHPADPVRPVWLQCKYGKFEILDFSKTGFRLRGRTYLAQKAFLEVELDLGDPTLNAELSDKFAKNFMIEVKWSRSREHNFDHGVSVYGGSARQWLLIYQYLLRATGATDANRLKVVANL